VRLVDVGTALAQRRYSAPVDVVLEVSDPLLPWNDGRWRLVGGPDGARCARSEDEPDLTLGVTDLGGAYLGGTELGGLAAAERVQVRAGGADMLPAVSAAFATSPAPWCPFVF
jgi:predicted acetyltransferase